MKVKVLLLAVLTLALSSCNSGKKKAEETEKEITMAYVDGWASGVAMTHVAQVILEQNGYDVDTKAAAVDLVYASMAQGDVDVFMEAWLPVTHGEKVKKFGDKIVSLNVNTDQARLGLVVPKYVTINSIEELNDVADKFDGKIIGIEKGAGITGMTNKALEEYELTNMEQLNSSGIAMLSELTKAIKEERDIVVALWAPHWAFGRFDLKFLDDPKKVYGETERIETFARAGFVEEDPWAGEFFKNFHLNDSEAGAILAFFKDGGNDRYATAKKWVAENQDIVNRWLPE
ncbi:glycine betaine ABC transporter substrate-binding protein [Sunxiuqinia indica]|uniref:glycine betaine ABC transporter substrate-binding protein n=1 Tax=Sunxiuqinia indica TaxID=2692584 RepID=UPI00135986C0|nr:glycine betaine ABC transporter substrate-binding protein [Sunxiuqinia indica]